MPLARTVAMSSIDTILREADRIATSTSRAPSLTRARDIAVPATRKGQNIFITPFGGWLWWLVKLKVRQLMGVEEAGWKSGEKEKRPESFRQRAL